ncbi:hypothetical protein [Actinoplanes sp. NPDC049599]|uniref:hypothetical protein n=1 Tax=Actinoplanes sp. NPDC049599 TaxID=3363903 RepID=UPI0037B8F5B8
MSHADQLRADALRWLLAIADNHHLPVPASITTYRVSTGWHLHLHLDDEQGEDVRRWAEALHLPMQADLRVNGSCESWTSVSASGTAPEIVFAGWNTMRIDSYCDHAAAVVVPVAVAA